ncbi:MAG TPA: polysaccharide pyruvyl transferase family protein, partial [Candidatus Thermoplasmatota archaeon]|nr:polysaccharide pyruvyl transferase family protein [Candidatus Thermoplasmatota archaeon]
MSAEKRRVLLMGAYGQDNLGDEAILEVHLQQLKGYDVTVVSTNPDQTSARYGVPSVQTYGGDRSRTLKAFWGSDVLVYGGGSLLKELKPPYFRYRLVTNLSAATLAAKTCGKGVAFSAMGVERLSTRTSRFLARRAANMSDLFLVRDEGSRRKLTEVGARKEAHVTADPAYLLEADRAAEARVEALLAPYMGKPVIVVNPICSSEVACPREQVTASFAALVNRIHETTSAQVLLLPFKTAGEDNDVELLHGLLAAVARKDRVSLAPLDLRPAEVAALLARVELFVGMRHHGVLIALAARTPVLAVPYAEKTEHLVDDFGLRAHALSAHLLTPEALSTAFDKAYPARAALR